jgi:DNA processing protein
MPSPECCAWATLARSPALDIPTLARALEIFGSARGILDASDASREHAALPEAARRYLSAAPRLRAAEQAWLEAPGHHLVPFLESRYPAPLRAVPRAPVALYVAGDPAALNHALLAVVGSRRPTRQGVETAVEFSRSLAEFGLTIASGLAAGIDQAAHRGALLAQSATIAVLGCGVDVVYPRGSRPLREQILERGALVSAFPPGTAPRRENFPRRNAIIAGSSLGTLVVEAAPSSGSLITARHATRLGRRVFAVPGSIHNPLSAGCHELIRRGATLAETPHDILRTLDFSSNSADFSALPAEVSRPVRGVGRTTGAASGMDKAHKILLDALGFDPVDLDQLVVRTGFKADAVSSMMLILELEGHVQAAPGGRYSRVFRSRR